MRRNDDPDASATIAFGIVGAILVFVIIVALQALFYRTQNEEFKRKMIAQAPEELSRLVAEQRERLGGYRWVNEKVGIAAIPIDRAMELTIRELNRARAAASLGPGAAPSLPAGTSRAARAGGSVTP
jgi:hypothetical protein